ncbi:YqaJ viral recombinase family protein [Methylophaga sp.]|uniref:YqaJ viral recombinase family nuclease n=1 Tax=Methylophaga sp. TaxID=2024840 RepID=UPI00271D6FC5|nr:YqaJ viral recombinase family protein [Methylophaga sp.]MDO8827820.1 YqaJ viral recombinase family protein [Methylophaga sp.]
MKIINLQQRTPEWHKWRTSGVSASEAIVVLGQCLLKTIYRLYTEKKGITLPDNLDANPFVQRGIRLEATARKSFENRYDTLLLPLCAESEEFPFLRASFDGISDEGIPVELKVPMEVNFRNAQQDGIESKIYKRYYYQVQHQILVAGSDKGYLSLYLNDKEQLDFLIERDNDLIDNLVFEARKFVDCLNKNKPPATDPKRDIYIPSGQELDKWNALAANYHSIEKMIEEFKVKIKPLEKEQVDIEKAFLKLIGDFAQAESAGLRISRYLAQGSIDYKAALLALHPDVDPTFLETFRKDSSERTRLTLKDEEKASVPFSMDAIMSANDGNFWF